MVVVSHLFFFLWKKLVRGAAHMSRPSHYLELSISRQPLPTIFGAVTFVFGVLVILSYFI